MEESFADLLEKKPQWLFLEWDIKKFLPEIEKMYGIHFPIYQVMYIFDEEGRGTELFAICNGEKEDIRKLVDHASSLMGPRDNMISFLPAELWYAVRVWLSSIRETMDRIEQQESTAKRNEERLEKLKEKLAILKKVGPVWKIKPSTEEQMCPHCFKIFQDGREK
jgi:hypothetical protein